MIPLNEDQFGKLASDDACSTVAWTPPSAPPSAQWRGRASFRSRERRVVFALALIWGLSMLDLGLTLAITTTSGMHETNPFARAMVNATGTAYSLAAWKIVWTTLGTVILMALRRRWKAEAAAWLCVAALGFTTLTWVRYLECEEVQALNGTISRHNAPEDWMGGPSLRSSKTERAAAPRSKTPVNGWEPELGGVVGVQPLLGESVGGRSIPGAP